MDLLSELLSQFGIPGLFIGVLLVALWRIGKYVNTLTTNYRGDVDKCFQANREDKDKMISVVESNSAVISEICTLIKARGS